MKNFSNVFFSYTKKNNKLFLIMRTTFILAFVCLFNITASVYSQNTQLDINVKETTVRDVFKLIESQSEFRFFYNDDFVDLNKRITYGVTGARVEDVLNAILDKSDVSYKVLDNNLIVIAPAAELKIQGIPVTGTITDETGEPIPGVNVRIDGTTTGVVTNINGTFSINVPDENAVLVLSFIGFTSQNITVGSQRNFTVTMTEDTKEIEEVVVVGYGIQKKVNLTGAVSSVRSDEFLTTKADNVKVRLAGKLPGVSIVQSSSEPGTFASPSIQIRGMGKPLIVIDGIISDNTRIDRMNPEEIESISVLKDASAAIYGVKAANGVVLITTKRGETGKTRVDYSGYYGWQRATVWPEVLSPYEYAVMRNENVLMNAMSAGQNMPAPDQLPFSQETIEKYRNGTLEGTNWVDAALRKTAPMTQHSLSVSGGTEKITYYLNVGYLNVAGFFKTNDAKNDRINIRSNVTAKLTDNLKLEFLLSGSRNTKDQSHIDPREVFRRGIIQDPTLPVYLNDDPDYLMYTGNKWNPVLMVDKDLYGYKSWLWLLFEGTGNLTYDVPFVKGLQLRGSMNYQTQSRDATEYIRQASLYTEENGTIVPHDATRDNKPYNHIKRMLRSFNAVQTQFSVSYDRTFNNHHISALALYEGISAKNDNYGAEGGISSSIDALHQVTLDKNIQASSGQYNPNNDFSNDGGAWEYTKMSYVGKLNYDFSSRYLFEFTIRADASAMLAPGHRWGYFPSASIGWRASEESFFKNTEALSFINNLKLRASYGKLGDDNVDAFLYATGYYYPSNRTAYITRGYAFDGQWMAMMTPSAAPNNNISWITSTTSNIGIDLDMWNGLLGVSFDVFSRVRKGLITNSLATIPGTVGVGNITPKGGFNGDIIRGFDLALTHQNRIGDFGYGIHGNLAFSRQSWRHIERNPSGNSFLDWRNNTDGRYTEMVWGYRRIGQYESYEQILNSPIYTSGNSIFNPGDYMYEDWNNDGYINDSDRVPIARTYKKPTLLYGVTFEADYKGFDLSFLIQGVGENYWENNSSSVKTLVRGINDDEDGIRSGLSAYYDRWHLENPSMDPKSSDAVWIPGKYPTTNTNSTVRTYNEFVSDGNYTRANYVRLKNLEIGYSIPSTVLSRIKIDKARIFVNGTNLLTFSKFKLFDPEQGAFGDYYPLVKIYSVGATITF